MSGEIQAALNRRRRWLVRNPKWRPYDWNDKRGKRVLIGVVGDETREGKAYDDSVKVFWHRVPGLEKKLKPENRVYDS